MKLSKKQQKIWVILVMIASIALILTSMIPFLAAVFR